MPCVSNYMEATGYEIELSRVTCLLDELAGVKREKGWWTGYHHRVYCKSDRVTGDMLVRDLCTALQDRDVFQCSLEMQTWWRDHQAADKARLEDELKQQKTEADYQTALAKLTAHERELIGLSQRSGGSHT